MFTPSVLLYIIIGDTDATTRLDCASMYDMPRLIADAHIFGATGKAIWVRITGDDVRAGAAYQQVMRKPT
jgi:hypothetical protein